MRFARSIEETERLLAAVAAFCRAQGADAGVVFACELAAEELFTNFVKYNRGGADHIDLDLGVDAGMLTLTLTDFEVDSFDPRQAPVVDVTLPASQRRPGGLGLHLVRAYADDLRYEYNERTMRITVMKKLEAGDVRDSTR